LKGGVITLEHDLYTQTVNVAGPLLDMGMKKGLEPMDIARCVNDPHPYQNSLIQNKPAAVKKPAAAAPAPAAPAAPADAAPKPVIQGAQIPLNDAKEDENIPSEGDSSEEQTIEEAGKKSKSDAGRVGYAMSSLVVVVLSALMAL
ncbi:hypothetical protein BGZ94_003977, partial [Podila epigama]